MTALSIFSRLPFVSVTIQANNKSLTLDHVLVDTGSAGTLFKTIDLEKIDIFLSPEDRIVRLQGIGGSEFVVQKRVDAVQVGDLVVNAMLIQLGAVNYDFAIDGILGFDFLTRAGAVIDFTKMEIRKG